MYNTFTLSEIKYFSNIAYSPKLTKRLKGLNHSLIYVYFLNMTISRVIKMKRV